MLEIPDLTVPRLVPIGLADAVLDAVGSGGLALVRGIAERADALDLVDTLGARFRPVSLPGSRPLHEVLEIAARNVVTQATGWHFDQSFADDPPDWCALWAEEIGDSAPPTAFVDTAMVVQQLPPRLLALLREQTAAHYSNDGSVFAHHSCIARTEGDQEGLFLAPTSVATFDGWSTSDSAPLLQYLFKMFDAPAYTVEHAWRSGDLMIWPNRRFAHRAGIGGVRGTRKLVRVMGHWRAAPVPSS